MRTVAWRMGLTVLALLACVSARAEAPPVPGPPGSTPQPAASGRRLDPPGGVLVAPGPAPDLALLYTGDVVGYIEPCG